MVHSYSEIVLGVRIPTQKAIELKFEDESERKDALQILEIYNSCSNPNDHNSFDNMYNLYMEDLYLESPHDDKELTFFPIHHDDEIAMGNAKDEKDFLILGYSMIKVAHRGYYENDTNDSVSLSDILKSSEKLKTALKKYNLENEEISLFHSSNDCGCCS